MREVLLMAKMDRNVNLEEINTDSFLGIEYTKHQTILQKGIFFGFTVFGVILFVMLTAMYNVSMGISLFFMIFIISLGVLFGCNYDENLSLYKYFYLRFTNKSTYLESCPMEDIRVFNEYERRNNKENTEDTVSEMTDEQMKKILLFMIVGFMVLLLGIGFLMSYTKHKADAIPEHHEAMIYIDRMSV